MSEEDQGGAESPEGQNGARAGKPETSGPDSGTATQPATTARGAGRAEPGEAHKVTRDAGVGETPTGSRRGTAVILAGLGLILLLGLGAGLYWVWQGQADLAKTLHERLDANDKRNAELAAGLTAQGRQINQDLQALRGLLSAQAKSLAELEHRRGREQGEWDIAEVEYFLTLAQRRLAWVNDVGSAMAALRVADARLRTLNDTRLVPVRQAIAGELRALDALPRADLGALARRLAALQGEVGDLPLKPVARTDAPDKAEAGKGQATRPAIGDWRAHLSSLRQVFTDLVKVRRIDTPARPLLSPEQIYFLRANLSLKLETARLALLRGDAALFRESIATARAWLEEYFNAGAPQVEQLALGLEELAAARLIDEVPDISASLTTLQNLTGRKPPGNETQP